MLRQAREVIEREKREEAAAAAASASAATSEKSYSNIAQNRSKTTPVAPDSKKEFKDTVKGLFDEPLQTKPQPSAKKITMTFAVGNSSRDPEKVITPQIEQPLLRPVAPPPIPSPEVSKPTPASVAITVAEVPAEFQTTEAHQEEVSNSFTASLSIDDSQKHERESAAVRILYLIRKFLRRARARRKAIVTLESLFPFVANKASSSASAAATHVHDHEICKTCRVELISYEQEL